LIQQTEHLETRAMREDLQDLRDWRAQVPGLTQVLDDESELS
jgi:hypothetical protein